MMLLKKLARMASYLFLLKMMKSKNKIKRKTALSLKQSLKQRRSLKTRISNLQMKVSNCADTSAASARRSSLPDPKDVTTLSAVLFGNKNLNKNKFRRSKFASKPVPNANLSKLKNKKSSQSRRKSRSKSRSKFDALRLQSKIFLCSHNN